MWWILGYGTSSFLNLCNRVIQNGWRDQAKSHVYSNTHTYLIACPTLEWRAAYITTAIEDDLRSPAPGGGSWKSDTPVSNISSSSRLSSNSGGKVTLFILAAFCKISFASRLRPWAARKGSDSGRILQGEIHDDVMTWKRFPRHWPFVWDFLYRFHSFISSFLTKHFMISYK